MMGTRRDVITATHPVPEVAVSAEPQGNVGWTITVENRRGNTVYVLWDESSYVNTAGQMAGRLVRGQTRKLHTGQAQPPSPVAPGATLVEWCVPENQVGAVGSFFSVGTANPEGRGTINLALRFDDGQRATWQGSVAYE